MSQSPTQDTSQYTDNKEHDPLFMAKRVVTTGSDNQVIIDESVSGTTYFGFGARGLATSATGWLLKKMVESGTTTTITHAIGSWDLRADAGTTYS